MKRLPGVGPFVWTGIGSRAKRKERWGWLQGGEKSLLPPHRENEVSSLDDDHIFRTMGTMTVG